jgi:hypothetical protein
VKNVIIIHGCADDKDDKFYNKHWQPWLKEKLIAKGIMAVNPLLPEPWTPDYGKFKTKFEKLEVNEESILIGHSCGCAFLVRWLGESKRKISKLILVAPWKIPQKKVQEKFYIYPIDETIKDRVDEIVMFTADDEDPDGKTSLKIYHEALGGKVIELSSHGHFTEGDMGTTEFPELFEEVI